MSKKSPKVSILICTYGMGENQRYLDLCLRSIHAQTFTDWETILVSSGPYIAKGDVDVHFHSGERLHYPAAVTAAYARANPESKLILFLNDDVIMAKDCLENLIFAMENFSGECILNPFSNCDNGKFYYGHFGMMPASYAFTALGQQYTIDEIEPFADQIIEHAFRYQPLLVDLPFNALYCTLMKRETYEKLGRIHEGYKTGFDDADLAFQAQKHGVKRLAAMNAACFHFSGATANKHLSDEDRVFNEALYRARTIYP